MANRDGDELALPGSMPGQAHPLTVLWVEGGPSDADLSASNELRRLCKSCIPKPMEFAKSRAVIQSLADACQSAICNARS
jgi:hypothetical protein